MDAVASGAPAAVAHAVRRVLAWADARSDVSAVALVGSWARGTGRADSDVDVVVLADDPTALVAGENLPTALGALALLGETRFGVLLAVRLAMPHDVELELGIAPPSWAATTPVDAGTARVVAGGMAILRDPDGLLAALSAAVRAREA